MISESKHSLGTHHHRPEAILKLSSVYCKWYECNGSLFWKNKLVMTTLKLCVFLDTMDFFFSVYIGICGSYPGMYERLLDCVGDFFFLECMR